MPSGLFRMLRPARRRWLPLLTLVAAIFAAQELSAQEPGRITGQVINAQTLEPISNAQVSVVGSTHGTLTDSRGNFVLVNIPAGEQRLQAQSVGYGQSTETVEVAGGEAVQVTIELAVSAVSLDEVVVTGQALRSIRREVGASIASIDASELEAAPVMSATQMLQSRVPGVTILPGGGEVGRGSRIVLRGPGSLSQDIEPIIYVDGVRYDNDKEAGLGGSPGSWTGLDDIDPAEIERIEVVKGAAAATLYGTEASAGVIQIFTKQGSGDRQTWNYRSEFGLSDNPREYWDIGVYGNYLYDNYIQTATNHSQQLGVSGSVDNFTYSVNGILRNSGGVVPNNSEDRKVFRTNVRFQPSDDFRFNIRSSYTTRQVEQPSGGHRANNLANNALRGGPRGVAHEPINLQDRERFQRQGRFTAAVQVDFTPITDFDHSITLGADISNNHNSTYDEFGSYRSTGGRMFNWRRQRKGINFDYRAGYRFQLTDAIRSTTGFGFQWYSMDDDRTRVTATGFPGPGLTAPIAAGSVVGWDSRSQRRSAGFYLEEQFGLHDRLFVTVGARADAHSAFGADHAYQIYPKIDASYVLSDHAFWQDGWGTFRLRGAYGTAGRQPGAYDKDMTWNPITALDGDVPAVTAHNLGNPDLAPEVSHEIESGFDASFLNERLGIEYTYYNQRTEGALYQYQSPPSEGFVRTQLRNVGEISNEGHEVGINFGVLTHRDLRWDIRGGLSTNRNRVVTLSGGAPMQVQYTQWIREGYPIGAFFHDRYILVDDEPILASEHYTLRDESGTPLLNEFGDTLRQEGWDYIGAAFPTLTLNMGSDLTLNRNLTLSVLVDYKGGHYLESTVSRQLSTDRVAPDDPFYNPDDPSTVHFAPGSPIGWWCVNPEDAIDDMRCSHPYEAIRGNHVYSADIWRLREVSLSYRIPADIANRFGMRNASVSLAGRNLWRQQAYPGLEAEANTSTNQLLRNQTYFDPPIPRQLQATIRVGF